MVLEARVHEGSHRRGIVGYDEGGSGMRPATWITRGSVCAAALAMMTTALVLSSTPVAQGATLPPGFQESIAFSGLTEPTVVRFAADGRVFVAEKRGVIKVFDSLTDTTPTVFADLNVNVYNFWDRGLLGMALSPNFQTDPYVYVLYTYDHVLGSTAPAPRWGTPGVYSDPCPTPPGATGDGCVVSARLSRLEANGNVMTGSEQVLVEDWCQQYPSHSIGTVEFGRDGALYATGGDGASFNFVDYGQDGNPLNPCGDPPSAPGTALAPPTAEGGSLRSQDLRTTGDPVSLDGSIIRVDPATGAGLPDQSTGRQHGRERAADHHVTVSATRSASPPAPAPTNCGSETSAGASGRRSTGSSAPRGASRTSAGRVTRAPAASPGTTERT